MNLISKKDLLAITGISYGQLYRWKRERLIPEEWFIKQSSYTGQETFFPREQILSRVQSILELKDQYSLDELAEILSPKASPSSLSIDDLEKIEGLSGELTRLLRELYGDGGFDIYDVAFLAAIFELSHEADLSPSEREDLIRRSKATSDRQKSGDALCTVFLSGERYHALFTQKPVPLEFDGGIEVVGQKSLSQIADRIKAQLKNNHR